MFKNVILILSIFGFTFGLSFSNKKDDKVLNNSEPQNHHSTIQQDKELILAEVLEVGMSKYFYLIDGNRIMGEIVEIADMKCLIKTDEGFLSVPIVDILEETVDVVKLDDTRYNGPLLNEDAESLLLRSRYGDVKIMKKEIFKLERYHGGILAPAIESKRRFDQGEDELIGQFFDSNAFLLEPNTFVLTPISIGYGFTDKIMISTNWADNFSGNLNIYPKIKLWHNKESSSESGLTLGIGVHQNYPIKRSVAKFSHAFINEEGDALSEGVDDWRYYDTNWDSEYLTGSDNDNVLIETYLVYSTKRKNPTGRGKVGWSIGIKTSNMMSHLKDVSLTNMGNSNTYELSDDNKFKIPLRVYGLFHYDLQKNIKFVASMYYDNSFRQLDLGESLNDFLGEDGHMFAFDSYRGEHVDFSFDFGFMYAVNDNFRLGIHFQQPYIDFHWEFFEF
tara:strand:+ start:828 stop:2168 length:1341 start_codon:yes stop_codon:yes gene_type:complete